MRNLINLELRKNNIRTYFLSALIITAVMLGLLYLFAAMPYIEPNASESLEFASYEAVLGLTGLINMVCFCVLSAVMYSRFVIGEYAGKQAMLLFSYPVSRKKIFLSKIVLISTLTIVGLIVSNMSIFLFFALTESVFSIVKDSFTFGVVIQLIFKTLSMAVLAAELGIVSMGIGFIKKSVPVTIVSAVILCSLITNFGTSGVVVVSALIAGAISIGVISSLLGRLNRMEV